MKTTTKNIRLILRPEVDERIRHYTALASGEFSSLGIVEECPEGFLVSDLFLLDQISTSGSTEIDPIAMGKLLHELEESGQDPSALRFWLHSHGSSDVFWSGTDHRTIDELLFADYGISLVVNKAGDRLARLDLYRPARVTVDDLLVEVRSETPGLLEQSQEEFRTRVDEQPLSFHQPLNKHPHHPLLSDMRIPHWADHDLPDFGPDLNLEQVEQQYMEGEIDWEEYCSRMDSLGVA